MSGPGIAILWKRLLSALGLRQVHRCSFALEGELAEYIYALAEREQRPAQEVIAELVRSGLSQRELSQEVWQRWYGLSHRERQVAALICLEYSTGEIAARLVISPETVKTHVRNILNKFDLHSRDELRMLLAGWDFSAWA